MTGAPLPPPGDGERRTELAPAALSLSLGGLALLIALGASLGPTRVALSWVALPLTLLLFVVDAAWMLRATQRGAGGMAGLLLAAASVALAAASLLLRRDHPWLS